MSKPLDAILEIASVGEELTCTLSAESLQVFFYALTFLDDVNAWKEDENDTVSSAEWEEIQTLLENATKEILE